MERERFIKNLMDIIRENYETYRDSKIPKFIKLRFYNKRKRKIYSIIENICSKNRLSSSILVEYIQLIYLEFPPFGKFQHIKAIKIKYDDEFTCTVEIPMRQMGREYMITSYIYYDFKENDLTIIFHCTDIDDKKNVFSFTDSHVRGFVDTNNEVSYRTYDYDVTIEGDIIRNRFIEVMVSDIESYLKYKVDFFDERKDM